MSEKFLNSHYEKLVGSENDMDYMELETRLHDCIYSDNGTLITDPEVILEKVYREVGASKYKKYELKKTPEDLELIALVKNTVIEYAKQYGKDEFVNITDEHIHLLKEGSLEKISGGRLLQGSHSSFFGEVKIDRRSDIETAITTFHELWHRLASYNALQITKEGMLQNYRTGLHIFSRQNAEDKLLGPVDEALTGYMTKRFFNEVIQNDEMFKEELELLNESGKTVDTSRQKEVKRFLEFVDLIFSKDESRFTNKKEIIDIFIKAQVTGNILPFVRLIDSTFGKGATRKLANFLN